ncbi:GDSL esterase/lipase At5g18430 [Arachis ipaensis]|uniref:GDSL esterase/lipase At5g18430 n=1 Tax=Arachis ipaensis TaxID=130454 RepID=UPI0007AF8A7A|nr:GDSL esterase/lipase At5g18430 [Arachis ipaensis]
MAQLFEGKKCSIFTNLFFLLFSISMLVVAYGNNNNNNVKKPTLFIFGDSTFDVGTNNFLKSIAKANILYNGIDFLYSIPTGRFSNGYNTADQIARQFGYMESPPPFLVLAKHPYSFKRNILGGANFASAGSGILKETGKKQWVEQFKFVREKINEKLGEEKACRFVSNALFLISVGSNDLFDFARNETSIRNPQQYLASLQATYFIHIKVS